MCKKIDGVEQLLTEEELLALFGISKESLARLRNKEGLPYLRVSRMSRLYLESSVMRWLKGREMVLNASEMHFEGAET